MNQVQNMDNKLVTFCLPSIELRCKKLNHLKQYQHKIGFPLLTDIGMSSRSVFSSPKKIEKLMMKFWFYSRPNLRVHHTKRTESISWWTSSSKLTSCTSDSDSELWINTGLYSSNLLSKYIIEFYSDSILNNRFFKKS